VALATTAEVKLPGTVRMRKTVRDSDSSQPVLYHESLLGGRGLDNATLGQTERSKMTKRYIRS
jgi:hypothetical protein